jgi:hypothetical protein
MDQVIISHHVFKSVVVVDGWLIEPFYGVSHKNRAKKSSIYCSIKSKLIKIRERQMIGRNVERDEIAKLISDYYLADSFAQQIALTDIIMDQLTSIPLDLLTVSKIRSTIEEEITVWMKMNQQSH